MGLTKAAKVILRSALLLASHLSGASLHVAKGPTRKCGSKILGAALLDSQVAKYPRGLIWRQVDAAPNLQSGRPVAVSENETHQILIRVAKCILALSLLTLLALSCRPNMDSK